MKSNHRNQNDIHVRMELKYCEHCGGLWVREGGAGVYCERCAPKVADLPVPRRVPNRAKKVTLPTAKETVLRDCAFEDLEAVGGVA